jgi:hypothetical protein
MKESDYKVVWPLGKLGYQNMALKPRIIDLKDKIICELSDYSFRGEEIFPIVREELNRKYPGIKFVEYTQFGNTHGSTEAEVVNTLPTMLREHGCDGVISGVGG